MFALGTRYSPVALAGRGHDWVGRRDACVEIELLWTRTSNRFT